MALTLNSLVMVIIFCEAPLGLMAYFHLICRSLARPSTCHLLCLCCELVSSVIVFCCCYFQSSCAEPFIYLFFLFASSLPSCFSLPASLHLGPLGFFFVMASSPSRRDVMYRAVREGKSSRHRKQNKTVSQQRKRKQRGSKLKTQTETKPAL